jgi:hypothetical protein
MGLTTLVWRLGPGRCPAWIYVRVTTALTAAGPGRHRRRLYVMRAGRDADAAPALADRRLSGRDEAEGASLGAIFGLWESLG